MSADHGIRPSPTRNDAEARLDRFTETVREKLKHMDAIMREGSSGTVTAYQIGLALCDIKAALVRAEPKVIQS